MLDIILVVAVLAALAILTLSLLPRALRRYSGWRYRGQRSLANIAEGTREGSLVTKLCGATVVATRFTCVIYGADTEHVIPSTSANDNIIGITQDVADAAEDPLNIAMIGGNAGTLRVVVSYAATAGDFIQSAGDGTAKLWVASGFAFGRVVKDTASGDIAEFVPVPTVLAHA